MSRGINNTFLYTAIKIMSFFSDQNNMISGRGTGFFIVKDGMKILVTNKHMIDCNFPKCDHPGFKLCAMTIEDRRIDEGTSLPTGATAYSLHNYSEFLLSDIAENDVACLINPIFDLGDKGNPVIEYWIPYEMLADEPTLGEKLQVCDTIVYPGYPEWFDRGNNNPIFRSGSIASDPRFDYSYKANMGNCIAYEGFSSGGSSGSPVFATQVNFQLDDGIKFSGSEDFYRKVMCVGINAGHFPDNSVKKAKLKTGEKICSFGQHSGISYFYKSSVIRKIIDDNTKK